MSFIGIVKGAGSETTYLLEIVQPVLSVTTTSYTPAVSPVWS